MDNYINGHLKNALPIDTIILITKKTIYNAMKKGDYLDKQSSRQLIQ